MSTGLNSVTEKGLMLVDMLAKQRVANLEP